MVFQVGANPNLAPSPLHNVSRVSQAPLESPTFDVLTMIFFKLNAEILHVTIQTCKFWEEATIDTERKKAFSEIKEFIQIIVDHLDQQTYSEEIDKLKNLLGKRYGALKGVNLLEIKGSVTELKKKIFSILWSISTEDLDVLEPLLNKKGSSFFGDFFQLNKKLREANSMTDEHDKSFAMSNISIELANDNQFDKAIEVANSIPDEHDKSYVLSSVSIELANDNQFDKGTCSRVLPDQNP